MSRTPKSAMTSTGTTDVASPTMNPASITRQTSQDRNDAP